MPRGVDLPDVLTVFEVCMTHSRFILRSARFGVVCAVVVLVPVVARAQATLSSVQRELDRVERETDREKELHKAERLRAADFEKQKNERLQALKDQMTLSDARIDSLKQ